MSLGEHLMQRGHREPAAQHRIRLGMAERHAPQGMQIAMRLDAFDVAAQSGERVHACAGHAPLPLLMVAVCFGSEPLASTKRTNGWLNCS
jgi:hypothetical protein